MLEAEKELQITQLISKLKPNIQTTKKLIQTLLTHMILISMGDEDFSEAELN